MTESVRISQGRPTVVTDADGWRIFLSVHDAEYLRKRAKFREQLIRAHPDHGGAAAAFRKLRSAEQRWLNDERAWYARFELEPPSARPHESRHAPTLMVPATSNSAAITMPPHWFGLHADGIPRRVVAALLDNEPHPIDLLADVSGVTIGRLRQILRLLKQAGFTFEETSQGISLQALPSHDVVRSHRVLRAFQERAVWRLSDLCRRTGASIACVRASICRYRKMGYVIATRALRADQDVEYHLVLWIDPSREASM